MASSIASGLQKVTDMSAKMASNPKVADMAKDTVNVEKKEAKMTTDFGVPIANTDHWLSASTEDRQGPSLLEDVHGREKVSDESDTLSAGL